MMRTPPTVILGAGLTGLSCAYHLQNDALVLEREREPGGVVRTTERHPGFFCDGTGHWLHLRDAAIKELVQRLLPGGLREHHRKAFIHLRGVFTPYPFQANTHGLPREVVLDCVLGLLRARVPAEFGQTVSPPNPPANFREWVERTFGEGIARHFMVPYNEKLLGVRLDELRPEYAERFIPRPSLEDVIKGALGFSRESLGYNASFLYPAQGGISALPRAFARALPRAPQYGATVAQVDLRGRTLTLADGQRIQYTHLVNTAGLPWFIGACPDVPDAIRGAASRLRATTVHYFDLGVRGPGDAASQHHWIYFPEPEFVFYRTGSYSAVHPESAPRGCRSYYVEMSGVPESLLRDTGTLKQRVLSDLRRARVLSDQDEILFMELCRIPDAYVIFDRDYERSRRELLDFLAEHRVISTGRWGGWGYGGMEDALLDGKAAAMRLRKA